MSIFVQVVVLRTVHQDFAIKKDALRTTTSGDDTAILKSHLDEIERTNVQEFPSS
jgi:hypothetical protein